MLVHKIDSIVALTAEKMGVEHDLVSNIIRYYYWWIFQRLEDVSYSCLHVPFIGAFYLSKTNFLQALPKYIRYIRENKNPKFWREKFRILWKARHKMERYYSANKNKINKCYVENR